MDTEGYVKSLASIPTDVLKRTIQDLNRDARKLSDVIKRLPSGNRQRQRAHRSLLGMKINLICEELHKRNPAVKREPLDKVFHDCVKARLGEEAYFDLLNEANRIRNEVL
jgi:hypothetical protein